MKFNEDSRVKIPAILHLTRLGYTYLSLKGLEYDETSNIVPSLFRQSIAALNPSASAHEIDNALGQLDLVLDNEDLGKQFYEKITATSGLKIFDLEDLDRNTYNVVTEFTCIYIWLSGKEVPHQIATILDTADQQLTLLRPQHTALGQQKRGLMQRLLTRNYGLHSARYLL